MRRNRMRPQHAKRPAANQFSNVQPNSVSTLINSAPIANRKNGATMLESMLPLKPVIALASRPTLASSAACKLLQKPPNADKPFAAIASRVMALGEQIHR